MQSIISVMKIRTMKKLLLLFPFLFVFSACDDSKKTEGISLYEQGVLDVLESSNEAFLAKIILNSGLNINEPLLLGGEGTLRCNEGKIVTCKESTVHTLEKFIGKGYYYDVMATLIVLDDYNMHDKRIKWVKNTKIGQLQDMIIANSSIVKVDRLVTLNMHLPLDDLFNYISEKESINRGAFLIDLQIDNHSSARYQVFLTHGMSVIWMNLLNLESRSRKR